MSARAWSDGLPLPPVPLAISVLLPHISGGVVKFHVYCRRIELPASIAPPANDKTAQTSGTSPVQRTPAHRFGCATHSGSLERTGTLKRVAKLVKMSPQEYRNQTRLKSRLPRPAALPGPGACVLSQPLPVLLGGRVQRGVGPRDPCSILTTSLHFSPLSRCGSSPRPNTRLVCYPA